MGILKNLLKRIRRSDDMRTNIPHGISQENRVHPLFIILRKHSEEEERIFRKLIRTAVWCTILNLLIVALSSLFYAKRCHTVVIIAVAMAITTILFLFEEWKTILNCLNREWLTFPKVNQMIHSDDYSTAILNYEKVVNMIGETRSMQSYLRCKITDIYRNLAYTAIILGTGIAAHFFSGGVF